MTEITFAKLKEATTAGTKSSVKQMTSRATAAITIVLLILLGVTSWLAFAPPWHAAAVSRGVGVAIYAVGWTAVMLFMGRWMHRR